MKYRLLIVSLSLFFAVIAFAQDEESGSDDSGSEEYSPSPESDGSGYVSLSAEGTTTVTEDDKLLLDFDDVDVKFVAQKIAELTGKNLIIENSISGKIKVITREPVTREEAFMAFISALKMKGYGLVQNGHFFKIMRTGDIKKNAHPTLVDDSVPLDSESDLVVTKLITIKNVQAKDLETTLKPFVDQRNIRTHEATNQLIITDTASNIARIERIIKELDVPGFSERIEFVVLKNAIAKDVSSKLSTMFNIGSSAGGGKNKSFSKVSYGGGERGGVSDIMISSIIADDRTNSLMIKGNDKGIDAIRTAAMHLDSDLSLYKSTQQIFIYQLEHADAPKVAEVLSGILNGLTKQKDPRYAGQGFSRFSMRYSAAQGEDEKETTIGGLAEEVKISADEKTNSLIIVATKMAYEALLPTITALDRKRKQVEIAATIMEIDLGDSNNFGISGYGGGMSGKTGFMAGANPGNALAAGTGDAAKAMGGLSGLVMGVGTTNNINLGNKFSIPGFMATLNATASTNNAKILSNPRLVTHDNEEAEIEVGNVVWVKSGYQRSTEGKMTDYTFDKEKATLLIKITPKINKSSEVTLKIDQDVKDLVNVENTDPNLPSHAISERRIKTVVMAKTGETIAIGGLIKDSVTKVETKVPMLGDIPVVGWLFKNQEKKINKTNLVLFLTPTVLDSAADRKMVTQKAIDKRSRHMAENNVQVDNWIGTNASNTHPAGITIDVSGSGSDNNGGSSTVLFDDDDSPGK